MLVLWGHVIMQLPADRFVYIKYSIPSITITMCISYLDFRPGSRNAYELFFSFCLAPCLWLRWTALITWLCWEDLNLGSFWSSVDCFDTCAGALPSLSRANCPCLFLSLSHKHTDVPQCSRARSSLVPESEKQVTQHGSIGSRVFGLWCVYRGCVCEGSWRNNDATWRCFFPVYCCSCVRGTPTAGMTVGWRLVSASFTLLFISGLCQKVIACRNWFPVFAKNGVFLFKLI